MRPLGNFLLAMYAAALCTAQPADPWVEFSAESSFVEDGQQQWAQVYFGDQQVRMEHQYPFHVILIADWRKNKEYEIYPGTSVHEKVMTRRNWELFVGGGPLQDPANPCGQILSWFAPDEPDAPKVSLESCTQGAEAVVNGRRTQPWYLLLRSEADILDAAKASHLRITAWADPELRFMIRMELLVDEGDGIFRSPYQNEGEAKPVAYFRELRNIRLGTQPRSLFDPDLVKPKPADKRYPKKD
jgi:hypothetical protein